MKIIAYFFIGFGICAGLWSGCALNGGNNSEIHNSSMRSQMNLLNLIESSTNYTKWDGNDWLKYDARLSELQSIADIQFESFDWQNIRICRTNVKVDVPKREFPIGDLETYFPPISDSSEIFLAVVDFPNDLIVKVGQPPSREVLNDISRVLQRSGVKKIVFLGRWHGLKVQINP